MKNKRAYRRLATCALCAGIVCGGTGCPKNNQSNSPSNNQSTNQSGTVTVNITQAEEGKVRFADSGGQETVLTIGKGSCTGSAQGKAAYRQSSCTYEPGSGKIKEEPVAVYLESPSGSAARDGDNLTYTQSVVLRVVKSGANGYDCSTSGAPLEMRGSVRVNTRGAETLALKPAQDGKLTFASSKTCSDAQGATLAATLNRVVDLSRAIQVACW